MAYLLAVGEGAPAPFWPAPVADGARFEQGKEGALFIVLYVMKPTREERRLVRKAKILARYLIDESGSMVLGLIGFKSKPTVFIFELVHDPTLYSAIEWGKRPGVGRNQHDHLLTHRLQHRDPPGYPLHEYARTLLAHLAGLMA